MKGGKAGRPRGPGKPVSSAPSARRGIAVAKVERVDPGAEVGSESKKARLRNAVKPKRGR